MKLHIIINRQLTLFLYKDVIEAKRMGRLHSSTLRNLLTNIQIFE